MRRKESGRVRLGSSEPLELQVWVEALPGSISSKLDRASG